MNLPLSNRSKWIWPISESIDLYLKFCGPLIKSALTSTRKKVGIKLLYHIFKKLYALLKINGVKEGVLECQLVTTS